MEAVTGGLMTCSLCGARVEVRRLPEYTADVYLKLAKTHAHVRCNI